MKMLFFILLAFIIATEIVITTTSSNLKKQSIAPNKVVITNGFDVMELFTSQG